MILLHVSRQKKTFNYKKNQLKKVTDTPKTLVDALLSVQKA